MRVFIKPANKYAHIMAEIDKILAPYSELEADIRRLMITLFSETCGMCTACCCRADICEESVESAFLGILLKKQGLRAHDMDERIGWLDLHGCSLEYGRPPICYSYFCDELLARLPDADSRLAAKVLGNLIHHIGCNALGRLHLVEIMQKADLDQVDFNGIARRLEEARAAYHVIENYTQSGRLTEADRGTLALITTDEP